MEKKFLTGIILDGALYSFPFNNYGKLVAGSNDTNENSKLGIIGFTGKDADPSSEITAGMTAVVNAWGSGWNPITNGTNLLIGTTTRDSVTRHDQIGLNSRGNIVLSKNFSDYNTERSALLNVYGGASFEVVRSQNGYTVDSGDTTDFFINVEGGTVVLPDPDQKQRGRMIIIKTASFSGEYGPLTVLTTTSGKASFYADARYSQLELTTYGDSITLVASNINGVENWYVVCVMPAAEFPFRPK